MAEEYFSLAYRIRVRNEVRASLKRRQAERTDVCGPEGPAGFWLKMAQEEGVEIGRGDWGVVYRVVLDGNFFAVKFTHLRPADMHDPYSLDVDAWEDVNYMEDVDRMVWECPNLPMLYATFTCSNCALFPRRRATDPCVITAMELADGDLRTMQAYMGTDVRTWNSVLFQVMAALSYLHSRTWIVHRDVKDLNVLCVRVRAGGTWRYVVHGREYNVENCGWVVLLSDFNVAYSLDPRKPMFRGRPRRDLGNRALIDGGELSVACIAGPSDGRKKFARARLSGVAAGSRMYVGQQFRQTRDGEVHGVYELNARQESLLARLGYPTDRVTRAFLLDADAQYPLDFADDVQDAIRMLVGRYARRTMPHQRHAVLRNVPKALRDRLRDYVTEKPGDYTMRRVHAGEFVRAFFAH